MSMSPDTAVCAFVEAEHRLFDGPEVALAGVSLTPHEGPRANGTAGTVLGGPSAGPVVPSSSVGAAGERVAVEDRLPCPPAMALRPAAPAPLRLHVAHLRSNPRSGIGQWVCEFTWRYRRALGDSRRDAFRRALACAHAHREVIHVR